MYRPLFFDRRQIADFNSLVNAYSDDDLASPKRSTVALLALLKDGAHILERIVETLSLPKQSGLHFEFKVKSPKGRGKASHTDLMIRHGIHAAAIETKWTEQPDKTVTTWLKKGKDRQNRENVLIGWLRLLQDHAPNIHQASDFGEVEYQTLHRAASACFESDSPQVVYLRFCLDGEEEFDGADPFMSELKHLMTLLGKPLRLPFHHFHLNMTAKGAYSKIANLTRGLPETGAAVKQALVGAPLFEFRELQHEVIHCE